MSSVPCPSPGLGPSGHPRPTCAPGMAKAAVSTGDLCLGWGFCPFLSLPHIPALCRVWRQDPVSPVEVRRGLSRARGLPTVELRPPVSGWEGGGGGPRRALGPRLAGVWLLWLRGSHPTGAAGRAGSGRPTSLLLAEPCPSCLRISAQSRRANPQQVWSFQSEDLLRFQQVVLRNSTSGRPCAPTPAGRRDRCELSGRRRAGSSGGGHLSIRASPAARRGGAPSYLPELCLPPPVLP